VAFLKELLKIYFDRSHSSPAFKGMGFSGSFNKKSSRLINRILTPIYKFLPYSVFLPPIIMFFELCSFSGKQTTVTLFNGIVATLLFLTNANFANENRFLS
jgi:hypothetical protein